MPLRPQMWPPSCIVSLGCGQSRPEEHNHLPAGQREHPAGAIHGHWVVQTVIKLGHPINITLATSWLESNMQKSLLDRRAVYVAITLVQQLLARSRKWVQDIWSMAMAMDRLVYTVQDDRHHGGDEWKPIAAMWHAPCRQHLRAGGWSTAGRR